MQKTVIVFARPGNRRPRSETIGAVSKVSEALHALPEMRSPDPSSSFLLLDLARSPFPLSEGFLCLIIMLKSPPKEEPKPP